MEDNVKTPSITPHFFHRLCIRPFQKLIQMCCRNSRLDDPITAHAACLVLRTDQLKQLNEHLVFCEKIQRKTIASDLHDSIAREKTEFSYTNHVKDPLPLNHTLKVTLFRAANELLTNIRKHAGTQKAKIVLSVTDKDIILQVKDRGTGMDTEKVKKHAGWRFWPLQPVIRTHTEFREYTYPKFSPGTGYTHHYHNRAAEKRKRS